MVTALPLAPYSLPFDRELLLEFFLEFSRFEYALKRARFLVPNGDAKPDWGGFARTLEGKFSDLPAQVQRAIQALTSRPPRRQVVRDGALSWQGTSVPSNEPLECYVLKLVRRVRNNLFHGGKFPDPDGPVQDMARDAELLRASLTVLRYCRQISPEVDHYFQEAP